MSFKLSLWKTKMETFQLPMNTVATTIKSYALIAASKVVCGADLNVSGKKPLSQGEMRIHFGVDKRTVQTPAPPGTSSASRVPHVASERAHEVVETIFSTWKTR
jgi:hypothetical protein